MNESVKRMRVAEGKGRREREREMREAWSVRGWQWVVED